MSEEIAPVATPAPKWDDQLVERPTGKGVWVMALLCWILGGLALLIGFLTPALNGSIPSAVEIELGISKMPTANPWKWPMLWAGMGLISLGFTFWCLSQIVRALFFLPGREITNREFGNQ